MSRAASITQSTIKEKGEFPENGNRIIDFSARALEQQKREPLIEWNGEQKHPRV
jgi:hypothetical protein